LRSKGKITGSGFLTLSDQISFVGKSCYYHIR